MKGSVRRQTTRSSLASLSNAISDLKTKCVTAIVYEDKGRTILQPVANEQDTATLKDLFQNNTLEVWLSNGKSDVTEYDISILKYKPQLQKSKVANVSKLRQPIFILNGMSKNRLKGFWRFHS
jgi:hypothetical protein